MEASVMRSYLFDLHFIRKVTSSQAFIANLSVFWVEECLAWEAGQMADVVLD